MSTITEALLSLHPTASWEMHDPEDFSTLVWLDNTIPVPTLDQVKKQQAIIDAQKAAVAYKEKRFKEYPYITEQLDMLWHAIDQGLPLDKSSDFYTSIAAVKDKYPKAS